MTEADKPRRDWRENAKFAANIVNSLAIPLLTVAATIVGLYATNTLKEREIAIATENNSQSLRNQREESETNLRSAMFRELVGPLLQSETEQVGRRRRHRPAARAAPGAAGRAAGAQLPRAFRARAAAALRRHAAGADRGSARAAAQHLAPRDLAPARAAAVVGRRPGQRPPPGRSSRSRSPPTAPSRPTQLLSCAAAGEAGASAAEPGSLTLTCSSTAQGAPLRIVSPDGRDSLQVNIRAVSWAAQTVGIYSVLLGANGESQAHTPPIEFTLSPYSFPFSDNTLLPSGNRFGIYLTRLDDIPGVARIMRLSFVWFPKEFVPPRERPFDLDVHEVDPSDAAAP